MTAVKAQMRVGETLVEITISNVSEGGLMAKCSDPPPVGTEIEILRRSARIAGEVAWTEGRRIGIRAYEPIDIAALLAQAGFQVNPGTAESTKPVIKSWWHWRHKD